jgi:hypothetical protein
MAQPAGTLGTKLFISQVAAATTDDTEIEYQARNYSEVGYVENFGEFGKQFDLVTFQAVGDGRTYKLKGGYNSGQIQLVVGTDLSDAGQILLATAADASNQDVYNFQIELNNSDTVYGAGTMYYFQAKVMSFRDNIGAVNNAIRATVSLEITSDLLTLPVGELFDRYNSNTDSLATIWRLHQQLIMVFWFLHQAMRVQALPQMVAKRSVVQRIWCSPPLVEQI